MPLKTLTYVIFEVDIKISTSNKFLGVKVKVFKKNSQISAKKRFTVAFSILLLAGSAIFINDKRLNSQVMDLINTLMSVGTGSFIGNSLGWIVIILIGILSVSVMVLFSAAIKELASD